MKIEEQVLSIEQMNHLKEFGLEVKDTAMVRYRVRTDKYGNMVIGRWHTIPAYEIPLMTGFEKYEIIPTLTLQEIIKILPNSIFVDDSWFDLTFGKHYVEYSNNMCGKYNVYYSECKNLLIDAAYRMLCWVLENSYLKCK